MTEKLDNIKKVVEIVSGIAGIAILCGYTVFMGKLIKKETEEEEY